MFVLKEQRREGSAGGLRYKTHARAKRPTADRKCAPGQSGACGGLGALEHNETTHSVF